RTGRHDRTAGRDHLRLGAHHGGQPLLRSGAHGRRAARRRRVRRRHRRRPRRHGGRQPRRARGRRRLGRVQHRAAARAGHEPVRADRPHLRPLLRAQGHAREGVRGVRALPGRLRHARRALRGPDPRADRQGLRLPDRALRQGVLARPARLHRRHRARQRPHLAGRPEPPLHHRRPQGGRADRRRLLPQTSRRRAGLPGQGRRAVRLRDLPSVDELLRSERLADVPREAAVDAARAALARAREGIRAGADPGDLVERTLAELDAATRPRLRRVINASGVVLHTNLGRAPLAEAALERLEEVARGYSNLEYDLADGARGSRQDHCAALLRRLTGAEAALVVNNNAAAVLLALAALAEGREVLVSRGELIEIGDGFRIPEVLARSGARLVEVGTTNRTRVADYERALAEATGAI